MIKDITVIGLGSLGSYFCQNLCNMEKLNKLVIVDYDVVQQKNLELSPYKKKDVGKLKVDALEKIVTDRNENIKVIKVNKKFEEDSLKLPKTDLVVDCRDFTYNRKGKIDTRLSISSKYLLVDCRKSVEYSTGYEGRYPIDIQRKDIIDAAEFAGSLVRKGLIEKMVDKQKVYAFELDYLETILTNNLNEITERKEMLFDMSSKAIEKFSNLLDCMDQIIFMNTASQITVYVGNKKYPVLQKTIPKRTLTSFNEVVSFLELMINPLDYKSYLILTNEKYKTIELIAEQAVA